MATIPFAGNRPLAAVPVLLTTLLLTAPARAQEPTFEGLGDLPGGIFASSAFGVSGDGSAVAGQSTVGSFVEAFRWTEQTGMEGLGFLPGGSFSQAFGASADGGVVAGNGDSDNGSEAFRWTAATGMEGLGSLPGGLFGTGARGVSADGEVVVGFGDGENGLEAFRWTAATGMVGLGDLPGGLFESEAFGVSGDGQVVVGTSSADDFNGEAFRWTAATGMEGLGFLPGGSFSQAFGASADGSVVVGVSTSDNGSEAFRWTAATGMEGLGDLPGGTVDSEALGVSADGVVVGRGGDASGAEAFIWTEARGMVSLRDSLVALGLGPALEGWALNEATGVSDDGRVVVGVGTNPRGEAEAFRAVLPPSGHRWVNPAGGAYDVATNWSPATVPGPDDAITFDLDATYTVTGAGAARGAALRGGAARRMIVADGTIDFADFALALTSTSPFDPSLSVNFDGLAKIVSGSATMVHAVVGDAAALPGDTTTTARLQVFNQGTILDGSGTLTVGSAGRGEVFVAAGELRTGEAALGDLAIGEVIAGNEGIWTVDGPLAVGVAAPGRLFVEEGGQVTSATAALGGLPAAAGSLADVSGVSPAGSPSQWAVNGDLSVREATRLNVRDGGEVAAVQVLVGADAVDFPIVEVTGIEDASGRRSTLLADSIRVGDGGDALFKVEGGALVETKSLVVSGSGTARVEFRDLNGTRSTLRARADDFGGRCEVDLPAGTVGGLAVEDGARAECDRLTVGAAGEGVVYVGGFGGATELVVSLDVVVGGAGTGVLRFDDGTVDAVDLASNPPSDPPDVFVFSTGRIEGRGILRGSLQSFGFVGPGLAVTPPPAPVRRGSEPVSSAAASGMGGGSPGGTLLIEGTYTQEPEAVLEIPLAGPDTTQQGRLRVRPLDGRPDLDGSAALAGLLRLFFQNDYAPSTGDAFVLLDATAVTGDFDDVHVFGLEPGWEFEVEIEDGVVVLTSLSDGVPTAAEPGAPEAPSAFTLHAAYPNPSTGRAMLGYDVPRAARVRVAAYDVLGREVAVLVDGEVTAGRHEAVLNGRGLPSGVYLVRMTTEAGFAQTRRVTLVR